MDLRTCTSINDATSLGMAPLNFSDKGHAKAQVPEEQECAGNHAVVGDVNIDHREIYFLIMHFLSLGPCQRTFSQFWNELLEHQLLPRRYHAWYSRNGELSGEKGDDGISFPLSYDDVVQRYNHIEKEHLVKLLKQLILNVAPLQSMVGGAAPSAADVPTLLGTGPFSLFGGTRNEVNTQVKPLPSYLRWPHMQADQVRGLSLRELGGGFTKHHRAPSIRFACYAIAKPSTMVQKMQNIKKLRGHRDAVYCAIFDRSGRYVITGSDDRLVKIWSMETAFCLASCRGHEGDITDLAVSSNNVLVASASNDYSIRVWRLPDGYPISTLRGHVGAVTAIAFSPRHNTMYQLLSSSDDGTCRIWDARHSQCIPRIYLPRQKDAVAGKSNGPSISSGPSLSNAPQSHQILCCAYNASGSAFVTGSSDTFARVWSAGRSNTDDSEQPNHEIDVLAGHENDVNYVQFSGCAVASRSLTSDSHTDEKIPRYRSSWYSHDNIVTCSRDGSAIIWTPRSHRSHGKVGRWTRAYHLKVPPPPMPPQPPRGGPRHRFLPTPRGVNMIVWSLDNRFVLAAIMDNRICVWNASDGSLVHSLTGHSASTYVLDVHPFNPRIAMSAGYDGKTIIWDIWEGTPIRIYEMGRFKLVDGKFSLDGTSIVLSDDVGQIYLLNTGQGESQKDSKYDQFFLGDYRPLTRDANGIIIDQETQLVPYRRNIQDSLCDSSMLPYPDPYQSMYQRRRLGAMNLEWRPSSIKLAVGTDIGLGQDFQILPLADLDVVVEPPPEFIDAMYWDPENDAIIDTTDSEYNITDENSSEDEHGSLSSSSSDSECSVENKVEKSYRDSLRRSKRKNIKAEVALTTSSGRHIKRRHLDGHDGSSSRSKKSKKSRNDRSTTKRKSSTSQSLRPQRVSARSLRTFSPQIEVSTDREDVDNTEDDSSGSESVHPRSLILNGDSMKQNYSDGLQANLNGTSIVGKHPIQSQTSTENRKKLVVKFLIRDSKKSVLPEETRNECNSQSNLASSRSAEENLNENCSNIRSGVSGPSVEIVEAGTSQELMSGSLVPMSSDLIFKADCINHTAELKDNSRPKPTILRIKSKKTVSDSGSPLKIKLSPAMDVLTGDGGDLIPEIPTRMNTEMNEVSYRREKFLESRTNLVGYDGTELVSTSNTRNYNLEEEFEVSEATTDAIRRTRSLRLKATSHATFDENHKLKGRMSIGTSRTAEKSHKVLDRLTSYESASTSGTSRSGLSRRKSNDASSKPNWLLLSEQEGHRYIPQLSDEVVYFRQGHQEYVERFRLLEEVPWKSFREHIRAVETCLVEELDYAYLPGSGESCCKLTLKFTDESSNVFDRTFKLTLAELVDFPDFVVEKSRYDAAIRRNWSLRDKCWVWWRDESKEGGKFWEGRIVTVENKSSEFPGSPWDRYLILYRHSEGNGEECDGEPYRHSPWELHDFDILWEQPQIDSVSRKTMLKCFSKLEKNQDTYGIQKLKQHTRKSEFINRFPAPLTLEIIEERLQNNYYRSVEAWWNDITIMLSNFQICVQKIPELSAKMERLSVLFDVTLSKL